MRNLLAETIEVLTQNNKKVEQMFWVGSQRGDYTLSWDEFAAIADVDYDSGYGTAQIASDLVVVGGYWWLERHEYDGAEWWEYKESPAKQTNVNSFSRLYARYGGTLDDINNPEDDEEY